jgi:hypothetical protein
MSTEPDLKALALAATANPNHHGHWEAFRAATRPAAVLALIAERDALRKAVEEIKAVGTQTVTQRVGDAYDPHGWQDYEIISPEAEIAAAVLQQVGAGE